MTGRLVENPPAPGSDEWYQSMSASKIAAVVGLSPYESRFSQWHRMAGLLPRQLQTEAMSRGHFLEDGIAQWFAHKHPDFTVHPTCSWMHPTVDWATAAPDRMLTTPNGPAILEIKADDGPDWDPREGTIPPGYYAQVQWQLMCADLPKAYIAMLGPFLRFDEYVIPADTKYQAWLLAEATAFMESLPGGPNEQRPNLDSHTETYEAVKALHPDIDGSDVEVSPDLADAYLKALCAYRDAEAAVNETRSRMADAVGDGKRAVCNKQRIAYRRNGRPGNPPYLTVVSGLLDKYPTLNLKDAS